MLQAWGRYRICDLCYNQDKAFLVPGSVGTWVVFHRTDLLGKSTCACHFQGCIYRNTHLDVSLDASQTAFAAWYAHHGPIGNTQ